MKRPVVMILLAGALTLSMIAPSALPAVAGSVSVVHAAVKTSNDVTAETSSDEDAGEWKDKTETVYVDANADGSVKKITVKDWLRRNGDGEINGQDENPFAFDQTPWLNYSLNIGLEYKNFDFNMLLQGSALGSMEYK